MYNIAPKRSRLDKEKLASYGLLFEWDNDKVRQNIKNAWYYLSDEASTGLS